MKVNDLASIEGFASLKEIDVIKLVMWWSHQHEAKDGAFRATVVMAWNLAFDHVCYWILSDAKRLSDFNARALVRYPKEKYPPVTKREDFMDMKESHIIEIASSASLISTNVARVLKEKLTRRNMAAHPADVTTLQPTAEEFVRDIVENVVLKLQ